MYVVSRKRYHASFVIAVTSAFLATICYIISFVSPYWIVAKREINEGFERLGLWEVCFHNFIFPEDYVSKAYEGCWYIYYPEYKYIRYWLNPPWLYAVQILSIIGLGCTIAGLFTIILILCEVYGTKERKPKLTVIALESIALGCLLIMVITMGVMSKDRQWLPRPDHNRVSWSFAFAVISGFFTVICLFGLVTHYLSVESRIMMEDPTVRQKLLGPDSRYGYAKSVSGYDIGAGTDSRLGGVPSLFTMPVTGSQLVQGSVGMTGVGTASHLSRTTVAPGAVGPTTAGTSAATVSAKLRETLEAQRAAVLAANARATETGLPVTAAMSPSSAYSPSIYRSVSRPEPGVTGSFTRLVPHTGSVTHLQPPVAMDSTV